MPTEEDLALVQSMSYCLVTGNPFLTLAQETSRIQSADSGVSRTYRIPKLLLGTQ